MLKTFFFVLSPVQYDQVSESLLGVSTPLPGGFSFEEGFVPGHLGVPT